MTFQWMHRAHTSFGKHITALDEHPHSLGGCGTSRHHITSPHLTSPHLTSCHVKSHHVTSHYVMSRHVTSHHITSCTRPASTSTAKADWLPRQSVLQAGVPWLSRSEQSHGSLYPGNARHRSMRPGKAQIHLDSCQRLLPTMLEYCSQCPGTCQEARTMCRPRQAARFTSRHCSPCPGAEAPAAPSGPPVQKQTAAPAWCPHPVRGWSQMQGPCLTRGAS